MNEMMSTSVFFKRAQEVYGWLEDEQSKKLFEARIAWSCTGSNESIHEIFHMASDETKAILAEKKKKLHSVSKIVLYGAGEIGEFFYKQYELAQKDVIFCDRQYESKKSATGVAVVSPETMLDWVRTQENHDFFIVICAIPGYNGIKRFLLEQQIPSEKILPFFYEESTGQYFDPLVTFGEHEIFVDVGSFDGKTSCLFAEKCKNYERIFVFEPDENKMKTANETLRKANIERCTFFQIGLWDKKETLQFSNDLGIDGMSSSIGEGGNVLVECDCLDHLIAEEKVTFIKMDIEGAELSALMGAKNCIKTHKPKLAISIYHKPEDILELIRYIKTLVPEYRFYLRHYSNWSAETVLYAII